MYIVCLIGSEKLMNGENMCDVAQHDFHPHPWACGNSYAPFLPLERDIFNEQPIEWNAVRSAIVKTEIYMQ